MNIYEIREKTQEKWGIQLSRVIALVYKTSTKSMLRQSSSTLVKYVHYLIFISININENCGSKRKLVKKKSREKRRGKLISQNSFTHLFYIQMTKFIYYPNVYIRSNCLFFAMSWVTELLPSHFFLILTGTIPRPGFPLRC